MNRPESLWVRVQVCPVLPARGAGQQVSLHQHLKAIADADDRFAGVDKRPQRVGQVMAELIREDSAGVDVVAVAEPAGEGEHLGVVEDRRIFQQAINVHFFGPGPGQLKRVGGLGVAIGPGTAEDQRERLHGGSVNPL